MTDVQAEDLRAAALFRGVSARPRTSPRRRTSPPRICGICPVAYQMSAVHAMEDALGVTVAGPIRALRRLFYCGEWIESHALHVFMLHAPDFLGYQDAIQMAQDHPDVVKMGLTAEEDRQRHRHARRAAARSTPSTSGWAASTRLPTRAEPGAPGREPQVGPGGGGEDGALGGRLHLPGVRAGLRVRGPSANGAGISLQRRPGGVQQGAGHCRAQDYEQHFVEEQVRPFQRPAFQPEGTGASISSVPWPATT